MFLSKTRCSNFHLSFDALYTILKVDIRIIRMPPTKTSSSFYKAMEAYMLLKKGEYWIPIALSSHYIMLLLLTLLNLFLIEEVLPFPTKDFGAIMQAQKVVGSSKTVTVGPWGGHGGNEWDDGIHTGIRGITLIHDRCIDSIRVEYDQNGKPFLGEKHGGLGGSITTKIKLLYPDEYLTTVIGHSCPVVYGGSPVIRSLTFKSNRRTFGPFGVEDGTPFSLPTAGGMIVGFNGKSGWYLDSIGCHLSATRSVKMHEMLQQKLVKFGTMATKPFATAKS